MKSSDSDRLFVGVFLVVLAVLYLFAAGVIGYSMGHSSMCEDMGGIYIDDGCFKRTPLLEPYGK